MASVSMAMSMASAATQKSGFGGEPLFASLQSRAVFGSARKPTRSLKVQASLKEKAVTAATAAAMTASMMVPQVAEAAQGSPSLRNFLYSIIAGGVVLAAIGTAVIGVSYFDPVKRG